MDRYVTIAVRAVRGVGERWAARSAMERRALLFVSFFAALVFLTITGPAPHSAQSQVGLLPSGFRDWPSAVATDTFAVVAVSDNDERNIDAATKLRYSDMVTGTLRRLQPGALGFKYRLTFASDTRRVLGHITGSGGRGMELSTLQYWGAGKLFTCDDRTGVVYEIDAGTDGAAPSAVPQYVLADGDGRYPGPMRCEWAALKGDFLYIGSTGKPWTPEAGSSEPRHERQRWVKAVSPVGTVRHLDWTAAYEAIHAALGISGQGYVVHECAMWSSLRQRWYFVPRHVSSGPYKPRDEHGHGSTSIVVADAAFSKLRVIALPPSRTSSTAYGVSECKFVPDGRDTDIVLVKVLEHEAQRTFDTVVAVVSVDGRLLMDDVSVPGGAKYEGLELRPVLHRED